MKNNWSYSSFSLALTCPACWHRRYVLKEPETGSESADLAFGSAMHSAINDTLTGGNGTDVFKIYWDSYADKPLTFSRFKHHELDDIGHKLVARFAKKYAPLLRLEVAEQRLYAEFNGIQLEGTMDFYGGFDGKRSLLDWKTAAYAYPAEKRLTALQPRLYSFLAMANGFKDPEQEGYVVFNKGTSTIQTPLLWDYDKVTTERMLTEMTDLCRMFDNMTTFPRNPNAQRHVYDCYK